jgi:multicomponent Na+:H+ antiporter subunit F
VTTFIAAVAVILTLAMGLSLYRVLAGPTIFDRLIGINLIGTKAIILLLLLGVLSGRTEMFVDISLSYALISVVGILTLAKTFEGSGA